MELSIIIPVKNGARTIKRALSSLLTIRDVDYEIIVVDNMSDDSTIELARQWGEENAIDVTILECRRKGAPAARNQGLTQAKGKWIQFLDVDDELIGDIVYARLSHAEKFCLQVLIGSFELKDLPGNSVQLLLKIAPLNLVSECIGSTCSNLYKKQILQQINGWDENLTSSQEADLLFRCYLNDATIGTFNQSCCIVYTDGPNRISNKAVKERLNNYSLVRSRFVSSYPNSTLRLEFAVYRSIFNFEAPFFTRIMTLMKSFFQIHLS